MYSIKLVSNVIDGNICSAYTALHCTHYEVFFFKDGSAVITIYPTLLKMNGVDYKLGLNLPHIMAYIENENGDTIDKVRPQQAVDAGVVAGD